MSSQLSDQWMRHYAKYEPLPREEEQRLAAIIQADGPGVDEAVEKLVRHNIRFAVKIAGKWTAARDDIEMLVCEAIRGLYESALKFKPVGIKFISYAVHMIRSNMQRYVAYQGECVSLPMNSISRVRMMDKWDADFQSEHHRRPVVADFPDHLRMYAEAYLIFRSHHKELDAPLRSNESGSASYVDMIPGIWNSDDLVVDSDDARLVESMFDCYLEWRKGRPWAQYAGRNVEIVRKYYGIGCDKGTLESIGKEYGISRERTRQVVLEVSTDLRESGAFEWIRNQENVQSILNGRGKKVSAGSVGNPAWKSTTSKESFTAEEPESNPPISCPCSCAGDATMTSIQPEDSGDRHRKPHCLKP